MKLPVSRISLLATGIMGLVLFSSFTSEKNGDQLQMRSNQYDQKVEKTKSSLSEIEKQLKDLEVNPETGEKLNWKERITRDLVASKLEKNIQQNSPEQEETTDKSQIVALILCFVLGGFGVHRFYLGYTTIGIIQLLTLGGLGIWALIDLIRIATGDLKPKEGEYETTF